MLNNFCFHVYAQKSLSHSLTLTLSIFLTLTLSQLKIDNYFKQTCRLRPNDYTFPILCISSVTWHVLPSPDNKTFVSLPHSLHLLDHLTLAAPENKTFESLKPNFGYRRQAWQTKTDTFGSQLLSKTFHILVFPPFWLRRDNWRTYTELTRTGPTLSSSFSSSMRSATLMNFCSSSTPSLKRLITAVCIAVDVFLEQQF